jgi:hypothetical protein
MDKTQAQHFRNRWQAVAQIEQEEAHQATLEQRWQKLNAIYGLSQGLNLNPSPTGEMEVYQRWAKLKEKYQKA